MRWLLVHPGPEFSVADVYSGWREALIQLDQEVATFNMNDRMVFYNAALMETGYFDDEGRPQLRQAVDPEQAVKLAANGLMAACYQWWPDVVLVISGFFIPLDFLAVMKERGHKVVLLHTESPYEDERQLERAACATISLLNDPTNIDEFRKVGPAEYMPHAYRPRVHSPGPPTEDLVCDLTFNGTSFESRIKFFEAMDLDGLDVTLSGNWEHLPEDSPLSKLLAHEKDRCLDNGQVVQTYRSARCGINMYRREGEDSQIGKGWAMGPREVEMAATGLFFLRDPRPEGDEVLWMLPRFNGPGEASEQLRWYLAREERRIELAHQARQAIMNRTFRHNAEELLRLLDRQAVTIT